MIILGIGMSQLSRLMRKGAEDEPLRPVERPHLRVIEGSVSQFSSRTSPARHKR
ncbi:hypothetical protein FHS64_001226 [Brevundimonas terrae]|nr:hypothetical protein [Brevundimonas terrae]